MTPGGEKIILRLPERQVAFPRRPLLMAIVNITDDSFSGDGSLDASLALARAREAVVAGADIIDVGAESARTNREPITEEEEWRRLQPFLAAWSSVWEGVQPRDAEQVFPPISSLNTWRPGVSRRAVPEGVELLNDMSGLVEPDHAVLCRETGCALLIMHTVGLPKQNHEHVRYGDVVEAVADFFADRLAWCAEWGLPEEAVILDPGLGFAKQPEDDLRILARLADLQKFRRPLLLPISRKGFIGQVLDLPVAAERDAGTVGALVAATRRGGQIFRVHDVDAAWQSLRALQGLGPFG
jgi:dihydropteroate synthase